MHAFAGALHAATDRETLGYQSYRSVLRVQVYVRRQVEGDGEVTTEETAAIVLWAYNKGYTDATEVIIAAVQGAKAGLADGNADIERQVREKIAELDR